ncbi:MAG: hypothetical protein E6K59_09320 [Nitrospirae bacterium]|nr:MAG: hypothetical protein E6K59_09320 [Nitrospirota bacterium]
MKAYTITLWFLAFLFFLRVLGQVLVAFFDVVLQFKVGTDFSRGTGFFVIPRSGMGRFLLWFSYVYFAAMVLRYLVSMALYPERRWFGGTIPIFFHWVLAAYLFVLGLFHTRMGSPSSSEIAQGT